MSSDFKSKDYTIGALLSTTNPPIRVPEWQRNYSWTTSHVEAFWNDLLAFDERHPKESILNKGYFLGSIVLVNDGASHLLLDGQQRLTTATILLSVIRDYQRKYKADAAGRTQARFIADLDDTTASISFKITLNRFDCEFFRQEVQEERSEDDSTAPITEYESHRLIRLARKFFIKQFENQYATLGGGRPSFDWSLRIQRVLTQHMMVVGIHSDDEERAAEVFETLNDRGIGLSTPDLLRNLVLRRAPAEDYNAIIDCWASILEVDEDGDVQEFLRHSWLSRRGDVKTRSLYREIRDTIKREELDSLDLCRQLQADAILYKDILTANNHNPEIARLLSDVSMLGAKVMLPPLLSAFSREPTDATLCFLRVLIATYVRHSVIGGLENSRIETAFFELANALRHDGDFNAATERLRQLAPNDAAFRQAFQTASISRVATARYVLRAIEVEKRKTGEVAVETPDRVQLEHIYPQSPQEDAKWENHSAWINRVGNLTLLAKRLNIQARNLPFADKKSYYADSDLLLTRSLLALDNWNTAAVEERQRELADIAVNLWALSPKEANSE